MSDLVIDRAELVKKGLLANQEEHERFQRELAAKLAEIEEEEKVESLPVLKSYIQVGGYLLDESRLGTIETRVCEKHGEYTAEILGVFQKSDVWSPCKLCYAEKKEAELAEKRRIAVLERQQKIEAAIGMSGIPIRFKEKNFKNYSVEGSNQAESDSKKSVLMMAKAIADNFAAHQKKGSQIVFAGSVGTGKTHLANAIALSVIEQGKTALYATVTDIIRLVRDTWSRASKKTESQIVNELVNINLLIVDEIGVQYGTESERIILFDIIDKRYRDVKPTIFITNLSKQGMLEFVGERSFDRIREGGLWIDFKWKSYRSSKVQTIGEKNV